MFRTELKMNSSRGGGGVTISRKPNLTGDTTNRAGGNSLIISPLRSPVGENIHFSTRASSSSDRINSSSKTLGTNDSSDDRRYGYSRDVFRRQQTTMFVAAAPTAGLTYASSWLINRARYAWGPCRGCYQIRNNNYSSDKPNFKVKGKSRESRKNRFR